MVNDVLNALANKLYYEAYPAGERNLKGTVEIAEGLTSTSVSMKLGNITYKEENGQGQYIYDPAQKPEDSQSKVEYGKAILGDPMRDLGYVDTGVLKDGVYHFTKPETTIKIDGTKDEKENKRDMVLFGPWFSSVQAAISVHVDFCTVCHYGFGIIGCFVSMKLGNITYKDENGQGQYIYDPAQKPEDSQRKWNMAKRFLVIP